MAAGIFATACDGPHESNRSSAEDAETAKRRHSSVDRSPGNQQDSPPATEAARERQRVFPPDTPGENTASSQPEELSDEIIDEWLGRAGRDPQSTLRQVLALPDAAERASLLEWILAAWTSDGRSDALEWAISYLERSPAPGAGDLIHGLLAPWAIENPVDALQWVRSRLPASHRMYGEAVIASTWSQTDPHALATWIGSQPEETVSRIWHEEHVNGLIQSDPAQAYARAERLAQDETVAELKRTILRSWLLEAPDKLEEWLESRPELKTAVKELQSETETP